MRHCTMEELLAVRDGDGSATSTKHVATCGRCTRELDRLGQQVAALRALPARRPPRDRWQVVMRQAVAERRQRQLKRAGWGALAVAAGLTLAVGVRAVGNGPGNDLPAAVQYQATAEVQDLMHESQQLEAALREFRPEGRVMSGRAASIIAEFEDRIALVDLGIVRARQSQTTEADLVNLWRNRVDLMQGLVNTHVTRASYVGF